MNEYQLTALAAELLSEQMSTLGDVSALSNTGQRALANLTRDELNCMRHLAKGTLSNTWGRDSKLAELEDELHHVKMYTLPPAPIFVKTWTESLDEVREGVREMAETLQTDIIDVPRDPHVGSINGDIGELVRITDEMNWGALSLTPALVTNPDIDPQDLDAIMLKSQFDNPADAQRCMDALAACDGAALAELSAAQLVQSLPGPQLEARCKESLRDAVALHALVNGNALVERARNRAERHLAPPVRNQAKGIER